MEAFDDIFEFGEPVRDEAPRRRPRVHAAPAPAPARSSGLGFLPTFISFGVICALGFGAGTLVQTSLSAFSPPPVAPVAQVERGFTF